MFAAPNPEPRVRREVARSAPKPPKRSPPPRERRSPPAAQAAPPRPSPPIILPPPAPLEFCLPPPPPPPPGWRGSCKAINAATGRQCALLGGHEGHHRHGTTTFTTVALTDADVARARARLDDAAQRRFTNPMTP